MEGTANAVPFIVFGSVTEMSVTTEDPTQPDLAKALLANAKSAILAAVEIHNKPIFPYRYEVSTLLAINAWELALKAYIALQLPSVKLIRPDGTAKPFPECLSCVSSALGKAFEAPRCNLETLYDYRNNIAHFYYQDLGVVVLGLLKSAVLFFVEFLEEHFDQRLDEETNLVLLPIGFQKPMSPIDFVSNRSASKDCSPEVKEFLQAIRKRSEHLLEQGIEDSIMVNYSLALMNESRVKNADLVAAINNASLQPNVIAVHNVVSSGTLVLDPSARPIRIVEETLYGTIFTETFHDVVRNAREKFSDFSQNARFNKIMKELKNNPNIRTTRLLDPNNPDSSAKDFYHKRIYDELAKHYAIAKSSLPSPQNGVTNVH
jgi:hypothetical protein